MGASESRPRNDNDTMTFYGQPEVDKFEMQVSPQLVARLQQKPFPQGSASILPVDPQRSDAHTSKYREFEEKYNANTVLRETEALLRRQKQIVTIPPNPNLEAKRCEVAQCYQSNATTTLNCSQQVREFRNAVQEYHKDLIASY